MKSVGEILTEDGDVEVVNYQPFWPCTLVSPVKYDKSCNFTKYSFPHFCWEEGKTTVLWTLCAISLSSNVIWMNVMEGISTEKYWRGWFIVFVARNCLDFYKSWGLNRHWKKDPFSKQINVMELKQMILQQSGCRNKQRNNTLKYSVGAIQSFYSTSVTTLPHSSSQLDTTWKGILVTNDVPNPSDVDDEEILNHMLSHFQHNHDVLSIKIVCMADYSIPYCNEKPLNADANMFDFNSSQWMHYTRSPTPTGNALEVSSYSTNDYIDMMVKYWKVAVFEVINLTEKKI